MYKLEYFEKAKEDYEKLDGSQKKIIDKGLDKIKQLGKLAGAPLKGKLCKCRKIKNRKHGLRIVFRPVEDSNEVEIMQIIVIGKRDQSSVYSNAEKRLSE